MKGDKIKKIQPEREKLIKEVFKCKKCSESYGFTRANGGPYFKFPPTIGATGKVKILFIGINPRISETNKDLHEKISNIKDFIALTTNIDPLTGEPYIAVDAKERHYRYHAKIIKDIFGSENFEKYAAVTEIFLCASKGSSNKLRRESEKGNVCEFLEKTVAQVGPEIIVVVGVPPYNYFKQKDIFEEDRLNISGKSKLNAKEVPIVKMHHPNDRRKFPPTDWTIGAIKNLLDGKGAPDTSNYLHASDNSTKNRVKRNKLEISVKWSENLGWKLWTYRNEIEALEKSEKPRIIIKLYDKEDCLYELNMNLDQWKEAMNTALKRNSWIKPNGGYFYALNKTHQKKPLKKAFKKQWDKYVGVCVAKSF
jgi:uracil-DNA glycosylase